MPQLSEGKTASIILAPADSYTVSASATTAVKGIYGAPSTTTTLTANFQTFGPYSVPAKLDISCASGTATYSLIGSMLPANWVDETGTTLRTPAGGSVGVGGVGGLVANDMAAATANRSLLQSALDAGGAVQVNEIGTVYVNQKLAIGDNTAFSMSPQCRLVQADGTNDNMIVTKAYLAAWVPITLAWSAGTQATVNWVSHGFVEGDYVWIDNTATVSSEQSKFKGVFRVEESPGADSFTIQVVRLPSTAPTGSWQAKRATVGAMLSSVTLDCNALNNVGGSPQQKHGVLWVGTANSTIRDIKVRNALKYGLMTCASTGLRINGVTGNDTASGDSSDTVKIYGPDFGTVARGIFGYSGDDGISVQPKEPAAYFGYMPAYGDCIGTVIGDVNAVCTRASTSLAVVYCSPNEYVGGILVDGVMGRSSGQAVRIQPGDNFAGAQLFSATISRVTANAASSSIRIGGGTGTSNFQVGKIVLNDCEHNPRTLAEPFIDVSSIVVGDKLTVRDCQSAVDSLVTPTWPTGSAAVFLQIGGGFDSVSVHECNMNGTSANARFVQLSNASNCRRIAVKGSRLKGNQGVNIIATPTQVPDVYFEDCDIDLTFGVNAPASVNVVAVGNTLNGTTVLVRQTAGTVTLAHGGNKLNGTASLTSGTVSATAW